MPEKRPAAVTRQQKELIVRALTDPKFRKQLSAEPDKALGFELTDLHRKEISMVLAAVKGIESQITAISDELLCAGGGCHIAVR